MAAPAAPVHFLLDGRTGWRSATLSGAVVVPAGNGAEILTLRADPQLGRRLDADSGTFGGLSDPTGLAVDREGGIYVADAAGHTVSRYDPCGGAFLPLPCVGGPGSAPRQLRRPRGLHVTGCGRLIAVDAGNRRVQVFALGSWALLEIWGPVDGAGRHVPGPPPAAPPGPGATRPAAAQDPWRDAPAGVWEPVDVVGLGDGTVLVSDEANGVLHRFGPDGRWRSAWDGAGAGLPPLVRPTALAVGAAGHVHVLDAATGQVRTLSADGIVLGTVETVDDLRGKLRATALATDAAGNLYVHGTSSAGLSAVVRCHGSGTPGQAVSGSCASPSTATALAFDADGWPLVASPGAGIRVLEPCAFERAGAFTSRPLDSLTPACRWHRITLHGAVPDLASVEVRTLTADLPPDEADLAALPDSSWQLAGRWVGAADGRWDCLVLSPPGRFLLVRLVLLGSGNVTPRLWRIEVEAPRSSSAEHLPAVWRATPDAGDFLDRFTALLDVTWDGIDRAVTDLPALLDPDATPADDGRDFLTWLASWFALAGVLAVPRPVLRRLVGHAAELYATKGTRRGIQAVVRILLGLEVDSRLPVPGIVEGYQLRRWAFLAQDGVGGARLGDCTTLWGARIEDRLQIGGHARIGAVRVLDTPDPWRDPLHTQAHRMTVFVPAARVRDADSRAVVQRAVTLFTPAHVVTTVEYVQPRFRVGVQATIGVDTALGRYPAGLVLADPQPSEPGDPTRLGVDAVLGSADLSLRPGYRVGRSSAVGSASL